MSPLFKALILLFNILYTTICTSACCCPNKTVINPDRILINHNATNQIITLKCHFFAFVYYYAEHKPINKAWGSPGNEANYITSNAQ